jgi:hypothetical protein
MVSLRYVFKLRLIDASWLKCDRGRLTFRRSDRVVGSGEFAYPLESSRINLLTTRNQSANAKVVGRPCLRDLNGT